MTRVNSTHLTPGASYRIRGFHESIDRHYKSRLLSMGFLPNAVFQVIRKAPFGNTLEIHIGECALSLRKSDLIHLKCEPVL
ncbi:MAG: iron transporter FeoA [Gammaproteobacteria bacterium]|nr:iron transporter FeoA [Gammaproteobacteria bacterium]